MNIPLRDFQLRANDYLDKLPISLTRYGHVVAIVSAPEEDEKVVEIKKQIENLHSKPVIKEMPHIEPNPDEFYSEPMTKPIPNPVHFHVSPLDGKTRVCPHNNEAGQCLLGCVDDKT